MAMNMLQSFKNICLGEKTDFFGEYRVDKDIVRSDDFFQRFLWGPPPYNIKYIKSTYQGFQI